MAGPPTFALPPTFLGTTRQAPAAYSVLGIPFDAGTTNRAGARHGPREIRSQSSFMRRVHHVTQVAPYDLVNVVDAGDAPVNPLDLMDSLRLIEGFFRDIRSHGARAIAAGGDHLVTLPILRALATDGPIGMVHFDAHSDTNDRYFGDNLYTHGTPFRRAVEEGLLDPKRVVQIGIRGSIYDSSDLDFAVSNGFRIVFMEEFATRKPEEIMAEARSIIGEQAVYVSFDVDALDPSMAPGTGTPEIGGITTFEAMRMLRCLRGLPIIGADVVEVSPPFDVSNTTSLVGATMMFELLCLMAEVIAAERPTALR